MNEEMSFLQQELDRSFADGLAEGERRGLERAAEIAENAHLVLPDGGSPTDDEYQVAQEAARRIRALTKEPTP